MAEKYQSREERRKQMQANQHKKKRKKTEKQIFNIYKAAHSCLLSCRAGRSHCGNQHFCVLRKQLPETDEEAVIRPDSIGD